MTFQAEDEIAAIGAALGASFAGQPGVTATSGPGLALKMETIGLAVMLELPLVICDIQRAGPATGMPTKTEQADLTQALYGRHGEAPLPVIAPQSPGDCFDAAFEAVKIAIDYRTPVILLSDGYLANGAEPWQVPDLASLPAIDPVFATAPNRPDGEFWPYLRDEKLARAWAMPGHARPRAPGRRDREGRRHRQRVLRSGQPRVHGEPAAAEGGQHRQGICRRSSSRIPVGRRGCWWWAGGPPTARSRRPLAGCGAWGVPWPRCICDI